MKSFVKPLLVSLLFLVWGIGTVFGMESVVLAEVSQFGELIVVEVTADVPVSLRTAWDVLTDFDHMASYIGNVTVSRVIRREGNALLVHQEGVARYGVLSYSFESQREIRLEPMSRIQTRSLSGSVKRMESESRFSQTESGTHISYRAEVEPNSMLAKMFGASFIRHEVEEQFNEMAKEMLKRHGRGQGSPQGR